MSREDVPVWGSLFPEWANENSLIKDFRKTHGIKPNFANKSSLDYSHWIDPIEVWNAQLIFGTKQMKTFLISSVKLALFTENSIKQIRDSWPFLYLAYLFRKVLLKKDLRKILIVKWRVSGCSNNKDHRVCITLKRLIGFGYSHTSSKTDKYSFKALLFCYCFSKGKPHLLSAL